MFDAWGQKPASAQVSQTTAVDYGHYDQCMANKILDDIFTSYCLTIVDDHHNHMSYTLGFCVPATCEKPALQDFFDLHQTVSYQFEVINCQSGRKSSSMNNLQWVTICVLGSYLVFVILCTCKILPKFRRFSLVKNFKKLILINDDTENSFNYFNGIGVVSMVEVDTYFFVTAFWIAVKFMKRQEKG